jgi:SlyX protein
MRHEERILELEQRIAYLEHQLDALDKVITGQSQEIGNLLKDRRLLLELAEEFRDVRVRSQTDESPPPHY